MEKYQLVKAESFHEDFIIKLNNENMPAVGRLDEKSLSLIHISEPTRPY